MSWVINLEGQFIYLFNLFIYFFIIKNNDKEEAIQHLPMVTTVFNVFFPFYFKQNRNALSKTHDHNRARHGQTTGKCVKLTFHLHQISSHLVKKIKKLKIPFLSIIKYSFQTRRERAFDCFLKCVIIKFLEKCPNTSWTLG